MNPHRLTRSAALGLTVVALAAPTAAAEIPHHASPDATPGGVAGPSQDLRNPDNRAIENALAQERYYGSYANTADRPAQDLRSPDTRDYAEGRGTFNAPEVTVVKVTEPSSPSTGLDWGDAGIGAGGMLGLTLLGLGTMLAVVHRRQSAASRRPATTG